tara:strand:+ start:25 stop:1158 length:1134 start_codon:yes stop_codon:yes gene_type:complete
MQQEYIGCGSLVNLKHILDKEKPNKILLVAKSSYLKSGAEEVMRPLLQQYQVNSFDSFSENPNLTEIEKGLKNCDLQADLTIAVGGGSAIDTAKLINLLAAHQEVGTPRDYVDGKLPIINKGAPLIAIPTTAGSGSEATKYIVVYQGRTKYSVAHDYVVPDYVVLDPELTMSMSRLHAAASGMDTLSQAIEAFWSVNSNSESKNYSRNAIRLALAHLKNSTNYKNPEAREKMMLAANYAGKAINIAKTTAAHAFAYAMTSYSGIPHGHAVGLNLGPVLVHNSGISDEDCLDPRGPNYVMKLITELCEFFGVDSARAVQEYLTTLMQNIGLETDIMRLNLGPQQLKDLGEKVNLQRLNNNPRKLTGENVLHKLLNENT